MGSCLHCYLCPFCESRLCGIRDNESSPVTWRCFHCNWNSESINLSGDSVSDLQSTPGCDILSSQQKHFNCSDRIIKTSRRNSNPSPSVSAMNSTFAPRRLHSTAPHRFTDRQTSTYGKKSRRKSEKRGSTSPKTPNPTQSFPILAHYDANIQSDASIAQNRTCPACCLIHKFSPFQVILPCFVTFPQ